MKRWSIAQLIGWGLVAIIIAAALLTAGTYVFATTGWLTLPARLFNAETVEQRYTVFIERYNQLESLEAQIDTLDTSIEEIQVKNSGYEDMGQWSIQDRADYDNYSKSRLSLVTAFNRSCAQYNSDWQNWFKTNSVALTKLGRVLPQSCEMRGN